MAEEIFSSHLEELWAVATDPRGQWLALSGRHPGGQSSKITLLSAQGAMLGSLRGHSKAVAGLCSGENGLLLSASVDGEIAAWQIPQDLKPGSKMIPYQGDPVQKIQSEDGVTSIAYLGGDSGCLIVGVAIPATPEVPASGVLFIYPRAGASFATKPSQKITLRAPIRVVTAARLKDVEGKEQTWVAAGGDDGLLVTYLKQADGNFALWRDLTAPTASDSAEGEALWTGHSGAVRALSFHPTTERLLSSGDDNTIRFWYLRGRVSYDERAGEEKQGGIHAMLFGPEGRDAKGEPVAARLVTAGQDGTIKLWPFDSKRPPKTHSTAKKSVRAMSVFRLGAESWLITVSEDRTAALFKFQDNSNIEAGPERTIRSELDRVLKELSSTDATRRGNALKNFAKEEDPEITKLAILHLGADDSVDVRLAAAEILGARGDLEARKELRKALRDREERVRRGALFALRKLEGESNIAPLEEALNVNFPDLRREAIALLPSLVEKNPETKIKARDLLLARLKDGDAEVRKRALEAFVSLEGKDGLAKALSIGIDNGSTDIALDAMRRAYREKVTQGANASILLASLSRSFESSDADIRRLAFYVAVSSRPELEKALSSVDDRARRAFGELQAPTKEPEAAQAPKDPNRVVKPKLGDRARVARGERADLEGIISFIEGEKATLIVAGQSWDVPAVDLELVAPASSLEGLPDNAQVAAAKAALSPDDYSPVISAMVARNMESALAAARALARLRDVRAFGTLLQLTREKDPKARYDVVLALRDLGDVRARERLSTLLDDTDREVRLLALDALDKLPGSTPQMVAKLGLLSKNADIHLHALQRLLPPVGLALDTESREILLQGLGSQVNERVRTEAFLILWTAAQRPETEAAGTTKRLVAEKAMSAPHAEVRRLGVRAASEHAMQGWASALLGEAVDDQDTVVQREAWKCLIAEARDHKRAAPLQAAVASRFAAILAWFNDQDKDKRDLAYDALWFSYPDAPEEPLRLAARSRFSAMRLRALEAAKRYADETWGWDLLRQGLDDEDEGVRERAYALLREHKGPRDIAAPSVGMSSRHANIRRQAALHFGSVHDSTGEVEPLLLRVLRDEDRGVRQNAFESLKGLAKEGRISVDPIRLGLDSFYVDLRRYALEDIERLKQDEREKRRGDLYRLLGDEKEEIRQLAYQILRRHAGSDDPEPLRAALTSPHRDLREPALKTLKDLDATRLARVQDVLTNHLNDENPKLRSQAYEAIVRAYGQGHLEPIKLALSSPWAELREFAARDVATATNTPAAESLLTQAMGDSVEEVRRVAFQSALLLAVGKPPKNDETIEDEANRLKALPTEKRNALSRVLGAALRSPYWDLKLLAARQLALLRDDRSLIPMAELLLDPVEGKKTERRAEAVDILSRLEDPRAGLILQQLLDDNSRDVRLRVVDGLAASTRSGRVESLREALSRALKDNDEKVRLHAYEALAKEASVPKEFLLPLALSSQFADLRRRAAEDVGKVSTEQAEPLRQPLAERLGDADPTVRLKALESLRRIAGADDEQVLLGALASAHWDVKLEASHALAERGDKRALGPLVDLLADPQASQIREACLKALDALGKLGDRRASLIVQRLLRRPDRDLQIAAVRALEACCRAGEVEPLLEALRLPDETVQIAAAESLARFGDPRGMQVFAKTLQSKDANIRRQVFKSYVALGLFGLKPNIGLTSDTDETLRNDALSVVVAYLYGVITKSGDLGTLSDDDLRDVKTSFATAERGDLRYAAARLFEVESTPAAFFDFASRQLLPLPVEGDLLSALEDPELPEEEEKGTAETVGINPEDLKKRDQERRQRRYQTIIAEAEKILRRVDDSDPQVRASAAQGVSRLAMSQGLEAFLHLADRGRNSIKNWLTKCIESQLTDVEGEAGFNFLLSLVDGVETVESRQRKHEKALNLTRTLDEAEKKRIEERARRDFELDSNQRHDLLALFFEKLESVFREYSELASDGKDPLDDLLLRTAQEDWDEVKRGSRDLNDDGGRRMYLSAVRSLGFPDPKAEAIDVEAEKSLKERIQAEYDARRQDNAKAIKQRRAEEDTLNLSRGGRFVLLLLSMLFRLREEKEKAKDRERAAYLLAALTHSDPKVRQSAIEPLSQRANREKFRKEADALIKRIKVKTPEEREKQSKKLAPTEILPELTPLGWPALHGNLLERQVFQELSTERYTVFWKNLSNRDVYRWTFYHQVVSVREHFERAEVALPEVVPAPRPTLLPEGADANVWRELAFGTYVGLLRASNESVPEKVRESAAKQIGNMAKAGLVSGELAISTLRHSLADPSARVRKGALSALESLLQSPLQALGMGLNSDHPDMSLYAISRLRRLGMKLERGKMIEAKSEMPSASRYFEYELDNQYKFWFIGAEGSKLITLSGRMGSTGQRRERECASAEEAQQEIQVRVEEKRKEGYREVSAPKSALIEGPRRWVVAEQTKREGARQLMISGLDSAHLKSRRKAQELLPEFFDEGSLEPTRHQMFASRSDVRSRIFAELINQDAKDPKLHPGIIAGLALGLQSPYEDLLLDTASALAKRPPLPKEVSDQVLTVLSRLLSSHQEATQRRAAEALASLGRIEAIQALAVRIDNDPAKSAAVNSIVDSIEKLAKGGALVLEANKPLREAAEKPLLRELDSQGEHRRRLSYAALLAISGKPLLPEKVGETRENTGVHDRAIALRYLTAAARTRFDDVRLDAISRLHRLEDSGANQILGELLLSPHDPVRANALRALGEHWIRGGSSEQLINALSTPSALEGVNATKVEIAALLSAPRTWAKAHSLPIPEYPTWQSKEHDLIFETLAVGLNAPRFEVRAQAMRSVGALGDARGLQLTKLHLPDDLRVFEQPVQQMVEAKRLSVLRGVAAESCGELLERGGIDQKLRGDLLRRLIILMRDPTLEIRSQAFFALGRHADERILPLLDASLLAPKTRRLDPLIIRSPELDAVEVTLTHDELFSLRTTAAKAVAARKYNQSHIRERLAELMSDNDKTARYAAADALKQLSGEDTEEYLLAAYKSPHEDMRGPAIQGLIDGGRPATAMKLLGESKANVTELILRLSRRDTTLIAAESAQVLSDKNAPASQGAIAAQVLGLLTGDLRKSSPAWKVTVFEGLYQALTHAGESWIESSRTSERPGLSDQERAAAAERATGMNRLFRAAASTFTAMVEASNEASAKLAESCARWLLLEGPRGLSPSRDVALRAIKSSRVSTQDPAWPVVQKALALCTNSIDPELRRLAANAIATLAPRTGLSPKLGDAIAAQGLVTAYLRATPAKEARGEVMKRFHEADGLTAVVSALLRTEDTETLIAFLKETRGRGVRDPERDTDKASKALHRRRLAAVHALSQPALAKQQQVLDSLKELAKDRVEPKDISKAATLAVRRIKKWKPKKQEAAAS
jgi:HEAT repeat protein/WD40 repeat protein/predicted DNA-binding WGR domain protein